MSFENIIYEEDGNVAIIKFNRPKALNAINPDVLAELSQALDMIEAGTNVKALVLTGEGDKAFIAGADIGHMASFSPLKGRQFALEGQTLLFRLEALPIPVIACVNGFALGGGTETAMACDFIYASENAKFGQPEINLGVIPGFGGTQRLSRLVGKAMAKELCMTGAIIGAGEAKEIGLVNKVFPADALWAETMKIAKQMAGKGRVSMKAIKNCIDRGFEVDIRTGQFMEADNFAICLSSPDGKEGMSAFLEKRKPEFKGGLV
ncbi:MAG: enoyl-CoA hydratase/isomerase family protein [Deltaproteobacteria bacterium]|jgi:enoyl-CoA hydratase|nr:enoyl-CoA hydratase/isomerase family protein [Deltaproteobacteria bacterium]